MHHFTSAVKILSVVDFCFSPRMIRLTGLMQCLLLSVETVRFASIFKMLKVSGLTSNREEGITETYIMKGDTL